MIRSGQSVLKEVMVMDYRSSGNHVFEEFCSFVEEKMKENYGFHHLYR